MAQTFRRLILAITVALAAIPGYSLDLLNQQSTSPNWSALNSQQREILAPLSGSWDSMDKHSRNKWLAIANRYPSMTAEEKIRTQTHISEWVKLSPQEHKIARERYKVLKHSSPSQKAKLKHKWREYQALPENEKKHLKSTTSQPDQARTLLEPSSPLKKKPLSHSVRPLTKPPYPIATP